MQNAKNELDDNKLCEENASQFTMLKKDAIKNAIGNKRNSKKTLQKIVEIEVNERFEKCGIKHHFHRQRLSDLVHNKSGHLQISEGLALAHVLNTFMVDFLNEDVACLGDFDIKILEETNDEKKLTYLFELEQKNPQIYRAYSRFPNYFCMQASPQIQLINEQRLSLFQNSSSQLHEFYPLESLLHFLFSPVLLIDNSQRITIIDKLLSIFESSNNKLYFLENNYYISNIQFFVNDVLIYIDIPCSHCVLIIKNKTTFEKLFRFLGNNYVRKTFHEESIYLLQHSRQLLEHNFNAAFNQLFDDSPPHLKQLLSKSRK